MHNIDNNATRLSIGSIDHPVNPAGKKLYDIDGQDENILIVGNDDRTGMSPAEINLLRTGGGDGSLSTDTMMIVHVPADGSKATLISLPRDSYVADPRLRHEQAQRGLLVRLPGLERQPQRQDRGRRRPADPHRREPHRACTSTTSSRSA